MVNQGCKKSKVSFFCDVSAFENKKTFVSRSVFSPGKGCLLVSGIHLSWGSVLLGNLSLWGDHGMFSYPSFRQVRIRFYIKLKSFFLSEVCLEFTCPGFVSRIYFQSGEGVFACLRDLSVQGDPFFLGICLFGGIMEYFHILLLGK